MIRALKAIYVPMLHIFISLEFVTPSTFMTKISNKVFQYQLKQQINFLINIFINNKIKDHIQSSLHVNQWLVLCSDGKTKCHRD